MFPKSSHQSAIRLCNSLCLKQITVQTIVFAKFHLVSWYIYNVYILHCQTVWPTPLPYYSFIKCIATLWLEIRF